MDFIARDTPSDYIENLVSLADPAIPAGAEEVMLEEITGAGEHEIRGKLRLVGSRTHEYTITIRFHPDPPALALIVEPPLLSLLPHLTATTLLAGALPALAVVRGGKMILVAVYDAEHAEELLAAAAARGDPLVDPARVASAHPSLFGCMVSTGEYDFVTMLGDDDEKECDDIIIDNPGTHSLQMIGITISEAILESLHKSITAGSTSAER